MFQHPEYVLRIRTVNLICALKVGLLALII